MFQCSNFVPFVYIITRFLSNGKASYVKRILWETLGLEVNQLDSLFQCTFESKSLGNFQKFLAWQCCRGTLTFREKLRRHGRSGSSICPRCEQEMETVLNATV